MGRQISIRLSDATLTKLDRRARHRRITRADLLRDALRAYLEHDGVPQSRPRKRTIERIRPLLGVIAELPADLASRAGNHLEDPGRSR